MHTYLPPSPLTPIDSSVNGADLPINASQLLQSGAWLVASRTKAVGYAMITLQARAWIETPAASLPADDQTLAALAMCSDDEWHSIKTHVLKDWILCDDARIYCKPLAAKAIIVIESNAKKTAYAEKQRAHGAKAAHAKGSKSKSKSNPFEIEQNPQASNPIAAMQHTAETIATEIFEIVKPYLGQFFAAAEIAPIADEVPAAENFALVVFDAEKVTADEETAKAKKIDSFKPQIKEVFEYWAVVMSKPRARMDKKRESKIYQRLSQDKFTVEDLKTAIDGCAKSDYHMGSSGTIYNDIELICRDVSKVENFMAKTAQIARPAAKASDAVSNTQSALMAMFGSADESGQLLIA